MSPLSKTTLRDWEAEHLQSPDFVEAVQVLESGYQVARLRMQRGLTQAQLAELVGTRRQSIARLENGQSHPSLSFLRRVVKVLNARIEVRLVPLDAADAPGA